MSTDDTFARQILSIQRRLYAYILTLVPSFSDADDILQQTNVVLLRKRDEYQPGTAFGSWACEVAHFEVLAYRKRHQRQRLVFNDELLKELGTEAAARSEQWERRLAILEQCTKQLSPRDRAMIHMRYQLGLSSEIIGARTGCTADAARRHLWRIRTALLRCIEGKLASIEE